MHYPSHEPNSQEWPSSVWAIVQNLKDLGHSEILEKIIFFYWLKKSFEPSRIRDRRSHTRPKSCPLKFRAITQALRNAPKRLPAINRYLLGGFSILTYHSILNFSNTPTGVVKSTLERRLLGLLGGVSQESDKVI